MSLMEILILLLIGELGFLAWDLQDIDCAITKSSDLLDEIRQRIEATNFHLYEIRKRA